MRRSVFILVFTLLSGFVISPNFSATKSKLSKNTIASTGPATEEHKPLKYIFCMVHDNPGEPLFDTKYHDPAYLKSQGFNGQIPRITLPCAITYDSFDKEIIPEGSKERQKIEAYAKKIDLRIQKAKQAGIPIYPLTDVLVVPGSLKAKYGKEMALPNEVSGNSTLGGGKLNVSILQPMTEKILRVQIDEIFKRFPDLGGLTIRFGETYLFNFPEYAGGSPAKTKEEQIRLINILRDEVCVKRNKKLIYRTWDFGYNFHENPEYYVDVTNAVKPHPNLIFSIKHVQNDFVRLHLFNPCLGLGKHQQIVEVSVNQAGLYGKNAHPYYIGKGVIDGWDEFSWMEHGRPAKCIRDLLSRPQFAGVWVWARGDGWAGPYINNELWVDLNAGVINRFAQEPWKSEEEIFDEVANSRFGVSGKNLAKLRELCLLSASAVMHGQATVYLHVEDWWCRDEYLTAIDLKPVVKAGKTEEVLKEKAEAINKWKKMVELSHEIQLPNKADQEFMEVSTKYGLIKYEIMEQIWKMQLLAAQSELNKTPLDINSMKKCIVEYDRLWKEWRKLKKDYACCPTLYRDDIAKYCPFPPFRQVLSKYRKECRL